jgi:hypothetical protein
MKHPAKKFETISEYIASFPQDTQRVLEEMRQTITNQLQKPRKQ